MILSYLDVLERANHGPHISEENWDLEKVAMTTIRLVQKYKLDWNPEVIVTDDPGLADAVFEAGLELAAEIGAYSRTTERIIEFSRSELEEGLRHMPQTLVMGEGKDARTLFSRKIMDERPPLVWAGNPGAPHPEALFLPSVLSWAQEPIVDMITCGTLAEVDGRQVRTADPTEIVATRRELQYLRQALRRVGRPGMGMLILRWAAWLGKRSPLSASWRRCGSLCRPAPRSRGAGAWSATPGCRAPGTSPAYPPCRRTRVGSPPC